MQLFNRSDKPRSQTGSYSTKNQPIIKLESLKARRPNSRCAYLVIALVGCLLLGFAGGWLGGWAQNHSHSVVATSTAAKQQYVSNESQLISQIAKDVGQSVVSINVTSQSTTQDFFGFLNSSSQQSAGTGFIISSDGTIVTNRHVVPSG